MVSATLYTVAKLLKALWILVTAEGPAKSLFLKGKIFYNKINNLATLKNGWQKTQKNVQYTVT